MKHASIRELFDYWNKRRGQRSAPDRGDIDPGAIRHILADTFILAYNPRAGHPFRIAGTRVCAAFGRELKGEPFASLWEADSKALLRDLLSVVGQESVGVVASASGDSAAGALDLELIMLPLSHRGRTDVRVLGALAPSKLPYWLGTSTLGPLALGTLRYLTAERTIPRHVMPAIPAGRIRRGLVVYDGGQS
jgi:hypothetical protein